jgi:hypothetical protein
MLSHPRVRSRRYPLLLLVSFLFVLYGRQFHSLFPSRLLRLLPVGVEGAEQLLPFPSSAYPVSAFPGTGVSRWSTCFPGSDGGGRRVSLGIAADAGFAALFESRLQALAFINQTLAVVNRVTHAQLGLVFVLGEVLLMDEPGTWAWNRWPNSSAKRATSATTAGLCGLGISEMLDAFSAWRRDERSNQQAVWHLLTNCFPPPGTVGLSWMGSLCRNDIGAGVSSFSSTLWLTLAHELGHSLGGAHSFQLGQGRTGGIMDYGR